MHRSIQQIAFVFIVFCSLATVWAEEKVVGGPYAVNVGQKAATIVWIVETGEVSVRKDSGKADTVAPVLRSKKVHFSNLEPGTRYYYKIDDSDEGKGSSENSALSYRHSFVFNHFLGSFRSGVFFGFWPVGVDTYAKFAEPTHVVVNEARLLSVG